MQFVITFKNEKVLEIDFEKLGQEAMIFTPRDQDQDSDDDFNDSQPTLVDYKVIGDYPTVKAVAREKDLKEIQTGALSMPKSTMQIEAKHTKTISATGLINRERLPKAKMMLNPDVLQKRQKLSDKELRDEVITLLLKEGELSFDDIQKEVDQPRVDLMSDTEPPARPTGRVV